MFITQYIYKRRQGREQKVGMFLGTVIDGQIRVGYSLCSKTDTFDPDYALALAAVRALSPEADECPASIWEDAVEFAERCLRYFKGYKLFIPTKPESTCYIVEVC